MTDDRHNLLRTRVIQTKGANPTHSIELSSGYAQLDVAHRSMAEPNLLLISFDYFVSVPASNLTLTFSVIIRITCFQHWFNYSLPCTALVLKLARTLISPAVKVDDPVISTRISAQESPM